jgi:NAD(P)H-quinone oxidoreductase subunit 5
MLFPMLVLGIFTLFVGAIRIPFSQQGMDLDILSKLLNIYLLYAFCSSIQ